MIQARSLTKIYGKTEAIRDVTFHVEKGDVLGFLGPNGAGKTTTMRILAGHTPPTSGTAAIAGLDVASDSLEVRSRLGYMPETIGFYEDMTVRAYLDFIAQAKGLSRSRRKSRLPETLEFCGLRENQSRLIRNLSKGFRQRVGLAQALVSDPEVLILDEPTVGLDPAQIREVRDLIRSMRGRKTIILSTHILPEVAPLCTRIAIINLGRIAAVGAPHELSRRPTHSRKLVLRAQGKPALIKETLSAIPGVRKIMETQKSQTSGPHLFQLDIEPRNQVQAEISKALVQRHCPILELHLEDVSLEDVYMDIVMGNQEGEKARVDRGL